jgi:hypothetical protein
LYSLYTLYIYQQELLHRPAKAQITWSEAERNDPVNTHAARRIEKSPLSLYSLLLCCCCVYKDFIHSLLCLYRQQIKS